MEDEAKQDQTLGDVSSLRTDDVNTDEEIIDPTYIMTDGIESKKDPKVEQDNLTPDHPRFKEVWRKLKESEETNKANKQMMDNLLAHNTELDKKISDSIVTNPPQPQEIDFDAEIRKVMVLRRKARQEDNDDEADEFEMELDKLKEQKLLAVLSKSVPKTKDIINEFTTSQTNQAFDEAQNKFITNSPWFDKNSSEFDPVMEAAAIGLDQQEYNKNPGSNPALRLAEIKKTIEERFSWKGAGIGTPLNLAVESGGVSLKSNSNVVALTSEDEEMIKRFYADDPEAVKRIIRQKTYLNKVRGQ